MLPAHNQSRDSLPYRIRLWRTQCSDCFVFFREPDKSFGALPRQHAVHFRILSLYTHLGMRPSQHIQPPLSSGASGVQPRVRLPAAFPPLLPQLQGADPRSYSHHAQGQLQPMSHEIAGANMIGVTDPRFHHQRFNVQPQMSPFFPPLHPPRQHHSIYYPPAVPPPPPNFTTASNPPGFLPPNPFHLPRPPPQHWPPEVPGHMHAMPPIATYPLPQFPHYQNQPETNFASGQMLGVPNAWGRGPPPPPEAGVPPPGGSGVGAVEQLDPFVEDWLKIVGAARKQRCPERSSLKVRSGVRLLSSRAHELSESHSPF